MKYTIQSTTETGTLMLQTESLSFAWWVADRMAEDFGTAEVYEYDNTTPVYTATHGTPAPAFEGGVL